MYIIIVGAGNIGSNLIDMASGDGNDVVVIEKDTTRANEIASSYDCMVLNADATSEGTLSDAGISQAEAVISTTNLDTVNVMVMLLAREHNVPNLVTVVHDPLHIPIFEKIGVHIVENPQRLIADHLYHSVRYPAIQNFMRLDDDAELIELQPEAGASILNVPLQEARARGLLPASALVAVVKRGDRVITPSGETEIRPGDRVTVLAGDSSIKRVLKAFGNGDHRP